ncbi:MAG: hypothetical protein KF684_01375 [Phycisphaeraceae bacterium]|nr:hypothetical protein [Phycisphaeraceae bacterium]
MNRFLLVSGATLATATIASATSVQVNFNNGTTNVTSALTGFSTTGAQMSGMTLTAFFSGGGSEMVTWGTTGAVSGGAFGTGWSLVQSGDTFTNNWTLVSTNASIDRILIDAGPGDTVFDTTFGGLFGTDGSARGLDFTVTGGGTGLDITATYINAVALTNAAPVGDLFRLLDIDFFGRGIAFANRTLTFQADTDNILFAGDIRPIPLPTTAGLGALGLCLISSASRRRLR